jgi:hypothetical protein
MLNLNHEQILRIREIEREIDLVQSNEPKKPLTAFQTFQNKQFNNVRQKMPHLNASEILELIKSKWYHSVSPQEIRELEK